jgi:Domain of unknown function (DUF4440)
MRPLLVALLALILSHPAFSQGDCDFLLTRTQAFSDAGQRGEGATMAQLLDPGVIFFNETGEKATRTDLAASTPPPKGSLVRTIATTDWDCKLYGNVAVTSFVDVVEQGKPGESKYRSVETWRKEGGVWKMIGSETLTLLQDPESVVLDADALDEYAGSYEAGPALKFTFEHKNGELMASLNGGTETAQKAQTRDIFFSPGHGATPKVFQRGQDGKINRVIYLRGKDSIIFKRVA